VSRYLLDVNALLALLDRAHSFHHAAWAWRARTHDARWMTCPLVQNGVVRIASQEKYPNYLGTAAEVRGRLGRLCAHPRHEFCPDDISLLDDAHLARPELLTPLRLTDVYLLALARHHGAKLATFDRGIPAEAAPDGRAALAILDASAA
jgi:hypothetical protein